MHHRHTGTGQAGHLGTPMYRLEACESRLGAVTRGTLYALQTSVAGRVQIMCMIVLYLADEIWYYIRHPQLT